MHHIPAPAGVETPSVGSYCENSDTIPIDAAQRLQGPEVSEVTSDLPCRSAQSVLAAAE